MLINFTSMNNSQTKSQKHFVFSTLSMTFMNFYLTPFIDHVIDKEENSLLDHFSYNLLYFLGRFMQKKELWL